MSSTMLRRRVFIVVAAATMVLSLLSIGAVGAAETTEPVRPVPVGAPGNDLQIVGGNPTSPGEYPFLVALVSSGTGNSWQGQFCGGSVIDSMWIMTAGHCVTEGNGSVSSPNSIDVVTGRHDINCYDFGGSPACTTGQRIDVTEVHRHPNYNNNSLNNDVALLKLASPTSSPAVDWATPADSSKFAAGVIATVMGWGQTESNPGFPDVPHDVNVQIISDAGCKSPNTNYPATWIIDATMLCAGDVQNGGVDSCQGDSGGPLVVPDGANWLQAGIVSWGIGCADPGYPGVYAEVAAFEAFIVGLVGGGGGGDDTMFLADNLMNWITNRFVARPQVKDEFGNKLTGATVTAEFSIDGVGQGEESLTTNTNGRAVFKLQNPPPGSVVEFCVVDVTHPDFTYDPGQNVDPECLTDTTPGGGGGGDEMHIANNTVLERGTRLIGRTQIRDDANDKVQSATVFSEWKVNGVGQGSINSTTNSNGWAKFVFKDFPTSSTIEYCVTNVTHATLTYNPAENTASVCVTVNT